MKRQRIDIKKIIKKKIEARHQKLIFINKGREMINQKNIRLNDRVNAVKPIDVHLLSGRERTALRAGLYVEKKEDSKSTFGLNEGNFVELTAIPTSIIISYKESGGDRKRNLQKILNFFSEYLSNNLELILVEQDIESKIDWLHTIKNYKYIKHIFLKNDNIFNKGWGFNVGAVYAKGDYLIFNDSDVLVSPKTYQTSLMLLEDFDVVNPYKYIYWLDETKTIDFIDNKYENNLELNEKLFAPSVITGGIFLIRRKVFLEIKGFDENSFGWGYQDYIFDEKIKKLEFKIKINESTALHLDHAGVRKPGTKNIISDDKYFSFKERNKEIYEAYKKMTKDDVINKINNVVTFGEGGVEIKNVASNIKLISVVMAYYNRRQHLINTLYSMTKSVYKNFEVIVVDDASSEEHRIEDLQNQFQFLKVFRIEKENKTHVNPCIPTNMAISQASGNIIIIQNPECFHYDDVFNHVANNLNENEYFVYTTVNKNISNQLKTINWSIDYEKQIGKIVKIDKNDSLTNQWYCHRIFRPVALNFCAAILRKDLIELNGFDERYANGVERDDVEFLDRIKRKKMKITFVDDIKVIHQAHPSFQYSHPNINELRFKNHDLYAKTTAIETIIRANPDKTILE